MEQPSGSLSARMSAAARELQDEPDPQRLLSVATRLAIENIDNADAACISLVRRNHELVSTPAFTSGIAQRCTELQAELGQGPSVDAIWDADVIVSPDLSREQRWPAWAPRAVADLGIGSMLCLRLFTLKDVLGGLNVYSLTVNAFGPEAVEQGLGIATHIAGAVSSAQRIAHLEAALDNHMSLATETVSDVNESCRLCGSAIIVEKPSPRHSRRHAASLETFQRVCTNPACGATPQRRHETP